MVSFGFQLLNLIPPLATVGSIVNILVVLVFSAISIKIGIRRYHDTGRSGARLVAKVLASTLLVIFAYVIWVLAALSGSDGLFFFGYLPFLGALLTSVWMIVILAQRGKPERNQFD